MSTADLICQLNDAIQKNDKQELERCYAELYNIALQRISGNETPNERTERRND